MWTLAVLYSSYVHLVTLEGSGINRISDLRGRTVSTGAAGSGTTVLANRMLHAAGLSNDLQGSLLAPSSEGQGRALRRAYRDAGWEPGSVDLVECHATGTPVGDAEELRSLRELRGDAAAPCVIGSVKSNVGHLLTGAGAAGLAKVLLAMRAGVLPPTANFRASPKGIVSRLPDWKTTVASGFSAYLR